MSAHTHIDPRRIAPRGAAPAAAVATAAARIGIVACALACSNAAAQTRDGIDLEPPLIEHEVLAEAEPAPVQSFVAQVVDDRELASVRLFWRLAGQTRFEPMPMVRVAGSSTWTARVPTPDGEARAIEYWIEARDVGGNRTVRGFAFSPLVRRIGTAPGRAADRGGPGRPRESRGGAPTPGVDGAPSEGGTGRGALWVVLGALGVALVVGLAASSGGGSGGGGECDAEGCEVTLVFDPPVAQ